MTTEIFGVSDDLIDFLGDVHGEVGCYGTDDRPRGVLVVCSDGTLLEVKYGKGKLGLWSVVVFVKGTLFDRIVECSPNDEDAERISDTAHFRDGLKWAYAATKWEPVS